MSKLDMKQEIFRYTDKEIRESSSEKEVYEKLFWNRYATKILEQLLDFQSVTR